MSGGSVKADPYHQPITSKDESKRPKPKRIDIDANGKKWYVYDCSDCNKEFKTKSPRKGKKTYCGDKCRNNAFGKIGSSKKGVPRSEEDKEKIGKGQKKSWEDDATRNNRVQGMKQNPRGKDKKKRASKKKKYSRVCPQCGNMYNTSRKDSKYCSRDCSSEAQKKGKNRTCAHPDCNKEFYVKPSKEEDRKYCSMDCAKSDPAYWDQVANTHKARYGRSWELPGWSEKDIDPQTWEPLAAGVRQQDGHSCQSCSRDKEPDENQFPVHHILPRSLGGPDEEWNLITLCPSCHRKTDAKGGPVRYPFESQTRLPDFDQSERGVGPF